MPTDFWVVTYMIVLWSSMIGVIAVSSEKTLHRLAVVMLISWIAARLADPVFGTIAVYGITNLLLCGVAVILGLLSQSPMGRRVSLVVAALFSAKYILCYQMFRLGYLHNLKQMWSFSEVFAYLQIIALVGGSVSGGKRSWIRSFNSGSRYPHTSRLAYLPSWLTVFFASSSAKD